MALLCHLFAWLVTLALQSALPHPLKGRYGFQSYSPGNRSFPLINALAKDKDGLLWIGTQESLTRFDGRTWHAFGGAEGLGDKNIKSLVRCPNGEMWVLTTGASYWWDGSRFHQAKERKLSDPEMAMVICDQKKIYCSSGGSLHWADLGSSFFPMPGTPKGLAICGWAAPDGSHQFFVFQDKEGKQTLYRHKKGHWDSQVLPPGTSAIRNMRVDKNGHLWLRPQDGLLISKTFGEKWVDLGSEITTSNISTDIPPLEEDLEGQIWTTDGQKLLVFDEGGKNYEISENEGLDLSQITTILTDPHDGVWIGGTGLQRLLGQSKVISHTRKQGLPDNLILSVTGTPDGRVFAGTQAGLAVFEKGVWKSFPECSGLSIESLFLDRQETLWAGLSVPRSGKSSIMRLKAGAKRFEPFPLPWSNADFIPKAFAEGPDGHLWLSAWVAGAYRIDRKKDKIEPLPPPPGKKDWGRLSTTVADQDGSMWLAGDFLAHWNGLNWVVLDKADGLPIKGRIHYLFASKPGTAELFDQDSPGMYLAHRTPKGLTCDPPLKTIPFEGVTYLAIPEPGGRVWYGSSSGLAGWDGKKLQRINKLEGMICEDTALNGGWRAQNGTLWVGTASGLLQVLPDAGAEIRPSAPLIMEVVDGSGKSVRHAQGPQIRYRNRTMSFRVGQSDYAQDARLRLQVRVQGLEEEWSHLEGAETRYPFLSEGSYTFEARTVDILGNASAPARFAFTIQAAWWNTWWARSLEALLSIALVMLLISWRTAIHKKRAELLEEKVVERTKELAEANRSLEEATMIDPLTGLHNRRFLNMTMTQEEARIRRTFHPAPEGRPVSSQEDCILFLIDLDHFKSVNDTCGHPAGDAILQETAVRLRNACRESDTVVRWGGEEFLLIAKRTSRDSAPTIAENIRRAINKHPFLLPGGDTRQVTCSLGFAPLPFVPQAPELYPWEYMIDLADQCMYTAKRSGRNAWVGCTLNVDVTSEKAEQLTHTLRSRLDMAVSSGEVVIHSSLKVDPTTWKA